MKVLLICFVFISFVTRGQDDRYDQLLEIAKQKGGVVLSRRPMTMKLDSWGLKRSTRHRKDSVLTDSLINQIVDAIKHWDTTYWEPGEFKGTAVVMDRKENLNAKKLLDEWRIDDKAERKKYRQQINKWTNTPVENRPINYLSRPVLTNDKRFGIVVWDLVSNGLCCGGEVILYKYESGQWTNLGAIYRWAH